MRNVWGKAGQYPCIECGNLAREWAYDGADPTQLYGPTHQGTWIFYSRFPEFYMPMCVLCHRKRDCGKAQAELREHRLSMVRKSLPKVNRRKRKRGLRPPTKSA